MTYVVIRDHQADDEIAAFGRYAADYSDRFAREQFARRSAFFPSISPSRLMSPAIFI
jgi:hypothetical protein